MGLEPWQVVVFLAASLARCLSRSLAASLAAYALARARAGCVLQQLQL